MASSDDTPGEFTLLYFAAASSFTGRTADRFAAPVPLGDLFSVVDAKYPGIREKVLATCAVTMNLEYVDLEEDAAKIIRAGDEVAIIPPVSSG